ncbi:hypothetical protein DWV16_14485 [Anaerotruncus sp. AF02-27]|nr:hypothetical protein DWV16_14485 [Anaerotruncus sp. AF02-27]
MLDKTRSQQGRKSIGHRPKYKNCKARYARATRFFYAPFGALDNALRALKGSYIKGDRTIYRNRIKADIKCFYLLRSKIFLLNPFQYHPAESH